MKLGTIALFAVICSFSNAFAASPALNGSLNLNGSTNLPVTVTPAGSGTYLGGSIKVGTDVYKIDSLSPEGMEGGRTADGQTSRIMYKTTAAGAQQMLQLKSNFTNQAFVTCSNTSSQFILIINAQTNSLSGNCVNLK